MFHEAGLPVPKDLLHNQWINYYNHKTDLINDTTPINEPCKMYWFENMKSPVRCNVNHQSAEVAECIMTINDPDETVAENLLLMCQSICQYQTISDLSLCSVRCGYIKNPNVFEMSKTTQSVMLDHCRLPLKILNHLIQQINEYKQLHTIDLSHTYLTGVSPLTLNNKKELTYLDLGEACMYTELAAAVCQELSELVHLEHLSLSNNDLSKVSSLSLCNKTSLKHLELCQTHMSAVLAAAVCHELSELVHLEHLNLSNNDLGWASSLTLSNKKSLKHLELANTEMSSCLCKHIGNQLNDLPQTKYINLEKLHVRLTALNKGDLQLLSKITESDKLPMIRELSLSDNTLTEFLASYVPDSCPSLPDLEKLRCEEPYQM